VVADSLQTMRHQEEVQRARTDPRLINLDPDLECLLRLAALVLCLWAGGDANGNCDEPVLDP